MVEGHEEEVGELARPDDAKEPEPHGKLLVATLGILLVTVLATVAASMAAMAGYHENVSNRDRQLLGEYATELRVASNQQASSSQEWWDTVTENYWRTKLLTVAAGQAQGLVLQSQLAGQAKVAAQQSAYDQRAPADTTPSIARPDSVPMCRGLSNSSDESTCAAELADAYGQSAYRYLRNERAYLAIVSILAIALFLFALTRTIDRFSMQIVFLGVGGLLTLVSLAWLVVEPMAEGARQPSVAGVRDYVVGSDALDHQPMNDGDLRSARQHLLVATQLAPQLPDAWSALATAWQFDAGGHVSSSGCARVRYDDAVALRLRPSSIAENDLAYDDLLCGRTHDAMALLDVARQDRSNDVVAGTWAEALLVSGHERRALDALYDAVISMVSPGHGALRGEVYQDLWFASIQSDEQLFSQLGVPERRLMPFFTEVRSLQALLDDFGALGHAPPKPKGPATISGTTLVADSALATGGAYGTPVKVRFSYTGLERGDVVTIRWDTVPFSSEDPSPFVPAPLPPPAVLVVGGPGAPAPGNGTFATDAWSYPSSGQYQLALAVDAVAQGAPVAVSVPVSSAQGSV
jgi:hypothetical protein